MAPRKSNCGECGEFFVKVSYPLESGKCKDLCKGCCKDNEAEWNDFRDLMANNLNDANRAKFLAMDIPLQRGIILQGIEDGVIGWSAPQQRV